MASPATRQVLFRRPSETVHGALMLGAIVNGTVDVLLEPGAWYVTLFIDANATSAGTITAAPLALDGTTVLIEDAPYVIGQAGSVAASLTLTDQVGQYQLAQLATGANAGFPIVVAGGIRFTIAAIAGASATNKLEYVAARVS